LAIEVPIQEVLGSTWVRASTLPAWAVLEPTLLPSSVPSSLPLAEPLRPWTAALADYLPTLRRQLAARPDVGARVR
jgi:hypothetical protein